MCDLSSLLNGIQIFSEDSNIVFCFLCGIFFSFSLENLTESSSEMSTNCREAAIAKNRQEVAKRQKAGTKARAHTRNLSDITFSIFHGVKIWKIRVFKVQ